MNNLIAKTIHLSNGTQDEKRSEILNYFRKTWEIDELLYTQLKSDEVLYHRGDPLRHILLFYVGHTAVFFINKLFLAKLIDTRINPGFESIFAIGVDEMSWDDLNERHYDWPSVDAVRDYRAKAKEVIEKVILTAPLTLPITWDDPMWIILMGIEHERIHLETSSVLIRQLPIDEVVPGRFGNICPESGDAPQNSFVAVTGAKIALGKNNDHPYYGWDNEFGQYTEEVKDFNASKFLISNGEFLRFIEAGGYHHSAYWTEEGWCWRNFKRAEMPLFWIKTGEEYCLRLVAEEIPMPWNWPVEVNYLEAKAYCNWRTATEGKNFRLMTEAEWVRLTELAGITDAPNWDKAPGNINLEHFASPCPVDKFANGDFYDVVGNVWQWTETPITGYPGFKVHPMYDDFSTPTFDGKHNLIKGGSWISTGNEAVLASRYAFRRHFYQHAGFRVVQSDEPLQIHNDEYETDVEIANSCETNWGDAFTTASNFSKALAQVAIKEMNGRTNCKVLDLNADTGRMAFELAQHFESVTALDFSARFIRLPIQLQEQGFIRYIVKDEDELVFYRDVVLTDTGLESGKDRILFMQADANNLKPLYTGYDLIIVPLLLEELINPVAFLHNIHNRLNKDGLLILASTYDWKKANINPDFRPGGFKKDGEPVTSFEGIQSMLSEHFTLRTTPFDLPRTLRKSSRIAEQQLVEVSVWKKEK